MTTGGHPIRRFCDAFGDRFPTVLHAPGQPTIYDATATEATQPGSNTRRMKAETMLATSDDGSEADGGSRRLGASLSGHGTLQPPPSTEPRAAQPRTDDSAPAAGFTSTADDSRPRASTSHGTSAPPLSNGVRRLSASKIAELTESLPIASLPNREPTAGGLHHLPLEPLDGPLPQPRAEPPEPLEPAAARASDVPWADGAPRRMQKHRNSTGSLRTLSTPPLSRRRSGAQLAGQQTARAASGSAGARRHSHNTTTPSAQQPHAKRDEAVPPAAALRSDTQRNAKAADGLGQAEHRRPSPIPPSIPLPPMSLPTLLQLELAGSRPSPLYIHHSHASDIPYESHAVKFERLKNFLLLPTYLERTMHFGVLACLDAWLWTLTILPIRFCVALGVLARWWAYVFGKEVRWLTAFVWLGLGRMWHRGRRRPPARQAAGTGGGGETSSAEGGRQRGRSSAGCGNDSTAEPSPAASSVHHPQGQPCAPAASEARPASTPHAATPRAGRSVWGHRRTMSTPSNLTSTHKADLLQGAVIVCSSLALMHLDASRMYHFIRAQSAVKLYVIYNLVEVGDRLLSALGQDIFECLFSAETLSRTASGRSKLLLPFGMFLLSLAYNIAHSVVLFYQVITLNVAVNSYSNALLSLLMSNQFVEVKSSVFKRTEKENTFQLACADIVERFQLWIVLFIIALRNIVEIGGLSVPGPGLDAGGDDGSAKVRLHNASILPASFTILPSWLVSVEVLSPFLIVIGSEMVVDWIKHGYINKFNNIKPAFYSRVLDILCKDYYTNAFRAPTLIRRLGLPLIPLCTLFIRSAVQTYHMFLATHVPSPLPPSVHTSLAVEPVLPSSPAVAASLERLDLLIRNALGRAVHGNPYGLGSDSPPVQTGWRWSNDELIAGTTMVVVFFVMFLILLIAKLLLGMALLRYARNRYATMKLAEHAASLGIAEPESFDATGKRTGGYGKVEVGEDRRRWIFQDDPEGLKKLRDKERREHGKSKEMDLSRITRYEMVAKRIW